MRFETEIAALASRRVPQPQVAPDGMHRVRPGQTLSQIANRYGTTVTALKRVNGIHNPHVVQAGQIIKISDAGTATLASSKYIRHRVSRGQTLSHIARRYGTSVGALKHHNGISNPRRLREGQVIKVPSG